MQSKNFFINNNYYKLKSLSSTKVGAWVVVVMVAGGEGGVGVVGGVGGGGGGESVGG